MDRKMNPLKLFDAGAGLLSSAVKSTANFIKQGPTVADRIASMVKRDDDEESAFKVDQTRIIVSTEKSSELETTIFKIQVLDKKNNTEITTNDRRWSDFEPVIQMIKGLYPKLDVPAAPPRAGARAAAIVVEERRKYAQAFLNVCVAHTGAAKQKELLQLIGFGPSGQLSLSASPSGSMASATPSNQSLSAAPTNASFSSPAVTRQTSVAEAPQTPSPGPARQVTFATPTQNPPPSAPQAAAALTPRDNLRPTATSAAPPAVPVEIDPQQDDRTLIDECFKIVDVDNSGYVTMDELEDFVRTLPKHVSSRAVSQCTDEADTDKTGAFDAKSFRTFMTRLAQVTRVGVVDMWRGFRRSKLQQVYEAVTDADAAARYEINRHELKPLLAVLQTGGLRQLSPAAAASVEYQLPYSFVEFEDIMDHLFRAIPPHELLKAMRRSTSAQTDGSLLTLGVINRYAGKASASLVRTVKDLVGRYGGTSCSNCAAVQAKHDAAEQTARQLRQEKEALQTQLASMAAQLQAAQAAAKDTVDAVTSRDKQIEELGATIAKLRTDLVKATEDKEHLITAMCDAQAELELEKQKAKAEAAGLPGFEYATDSDEEETAVGADKRAAAEATLAATRVNMYFLMPQQLGSNDETPVVDQPGALVYDLTPGQEHTGSTELYQPMGFASDVFIADTKVHEYISLRSTSGKRSIALVLEGGCISCPWDGRSAAVPSQRWIRLAIRLHWELHLFDVFVDGKPVSELQSIPFRDKGAANDAGTLDVFPRDSVAVYYANMHFYR